MIEGIDHVNLVVRDLGVMTAFYRDVLGFRVTKEATISGDWIAAVVGLEDVVANVVYLDPLFVRTASALRARSSGFGGVRRPVHLTRAKLCEAVPAQIAWSACLAIEGDNP